MSELRGEVGVLGGMRGGTGESADLIWGPGWDQINLRGLQIPGQREGQAPGAPLFLIRFSPGAFPTQPSLASCVSPPLPPPASVPPLSALPGVPQICSPATGTPGHRADGAPRTAAGQQ